MSGNKEVRVGVFDSGIGGLTVLKACLAAAPHFRYFYYGDNLRAPYGGRPPEEIAAFTQQAFERFRAEGTDAAVVACNTASAVCLGSLRRKFSFPVVGMEPAVAPAARLCKKILILCTPYTAGSSRLRTLLARFPARTFTVHAAPRLAGAIEDRFLRGVPFDLCDHLPRGEWDGVVLGCTHYGFFRREISAFYGAPVFDGAEGTARRLLAVVSSPDLDGEWKEKAKTNKSLPSEWSKTAANRVVFLGDSAENNRKVLKQMF